MTTSTPPPHPRSPLPIHNNYSSVRTTPGDECSSNNNNSSSWRTLTPPPKTNTMANSPLEAHVFHRLVDYLQEEQLHQSIMSHQQQEVVAAAATTTILPDVHAIDSDSVMSFLTAAEPEEEPQQHECGRSQPQLALTTTTTSPPPHCSASAKSSSTPAVVDGLTPRRTAGHDDELYHYNFDKYNNHQNKNDAMIEQQAVREEVLVHDGTSAATVEEDDDDDEDAVTWQWSWHHPKLAQFPDVASSVGSMALITSYHPALLVKNPPCIAKENEQEDKEDAESSEGVTWKCLANRRSIRLVRLATTGRMISGRVHPGNKRDCFRLTWNCTL
jgi:hypothetical protein